MTSEIAWLPDKWRDMQQLLLFLGRLAAAPKESLHYRVFSAVMSDVGKTGT